MRADIIGHEGVGRMTHAWRTSICCTGSSLPSLLCPSRSRSVKGPALYPVCSIVRTSAEPPGMVNYLRPSRGVTMARRSGSEEVSSLALCCQEEDL